MTQQPDETFLESEEQLNLEKCIPTLVFVGKVHINCTFLKKLKNKCCDTINLISISKYYSSSFTLYPGRLSDGYYLLKKLNTPQPYIFFVNFPCSPLLYCCMNMLPLVTVQLSESTNKILEPREQQLWHNENFHFLKTQLAT